MTSFRMTDYMEYNGCSFWPDVDHVHENSIETVGPYYSNISVIKYTHVILYISFSFCAYGGKMNIFIIMSRAWNYYIIRC